MYHKKSTEIIFFLQIASKINNFESSTIQNSEVKR